MGLKKKRQKPDDDSICASEGCWHYSERGIIYCICCYRGKCQDSRPLLREEQRELNARKQRKQITSS